jgi:hypothetical protein
MRWHRRRNAPKRILIRETEQFTRKLLHARQSHFIPSASWKAENIHIYLTIDPMGTIETIVMSISLCFAPESFLPIPFQLSFAYILTFYILLAEYLTQLQAAIMFLTKAISALLWQPQLSPFRNPKPPSPTSHHSKAYLKLNVAS